ncbi:Hypothetical protein PHPALM_874 [Phytophthora palmivora]|uniref:ZSWIM1/3 RNaseH-like domain-containing protein n=1 Tax=Phytophthora palmivora TaxID=4796 RepID=A0A2P4YTS2_9STRA|nr:Hypothetical protein PHPALM_874 [Phytophthora palmivora]
MATNYLCLRVRNSESREKYSSRKGSTRLPPNTTHLFKAYWCTHASSQASRGKGRRDRDCRYTGCETGFTVRSVKSIVNGCISLHNHKTNQVTTIPTVAPNRDSLLLKSVYPADINRYLSDKLDVILSPQQTRNILQLYLGSTTIERPKLILNRFAESDNGNDVLLVQNQLEVTCVIVMQTLAREPCIKRLLVTSSTGRGILVIDFFALDQKGETMLLIVEFFKRKNPSWNNIQTVVIDKDFVEWRILDDAFSSAKILLCQFHALTYWRKVCRRPKFDLKMAQRDEMEAAFAKLIYCTQSKFDSEAATFARICKKECSELLQYFQKNWKTCVTMWANHARGKFFSAGNSTTNRIESNWNQLKLLLGKRPRIDFTLGVRYSHTKQKSSETRYLLFESTPQHPVSPIPSQNFSFA